jgi:recyclin-1
MDAFLSYVLGALREHGSRAVRVFPPQAGVLGMFAERVGGEVVSTVSLPLISISTSIFLCFVLRASVLILLWVDIEGV